jgi:N-acetylglucosamine-6-sulfatase
VYRSWCGAPEVSRGVTRSQMALNKDLAPAFASWAGATPPAFVDGRSLAPLLSASPSTSWRTAFLIEHRSSDTEYPSVRDKPNYDALRTARHLYVKYATNEKELYNLSNDPYELTSLHRSADPALRADLQARLNALRGCTEEGCRTAVGGG